MSLGDRGSCHGPWLNQNHRVLHARTLAKIRSGPNLIGSFGGKVFFPQAYSIQTYGLARLRHFPSTPCSAPDLPCVTRSSENLAENSNERVVQLGMPEGLRLTMR